MKRPLICAMALMVLFFLTASALTAAVSLTIDASMPVIDQANALEAYLARLPAAQQEEWLAELALMPERLGQGTDPQALTVYIADSGTKYHRTQACRGLASAKRVTAVLLDAAVGMGREPCKICH